MYRYRNWVIDAFNRDQPYHQFIRDQIAGDIYAKRDNLATKDIAALRHLKFFSVTELSQPVRQLRDRINQRPFRERKGFFIRANGWLRICVRVVTGTL